MDPYEVLGISKDADMETVKKAFRKRALETHPDHNQDNPAAEEEFKKVNEAYNQILNPDTGPESTGFDPFSFFRSHGFNFGFNNNNPGPQRGNDLQFHLLVSIADIILGGTFTVEYERHGKCPECDGKGGEDTIPCNACNGQGWRVDSFRAGPNQFVQSRQVCRECKGSGVTIKKACHKCFTQGIAVEAMKEQVIIPPHENKEINPLQRFSHIVIPEKGNYAQRGLPGNLIVTVIPVFPTIDELGEEQKAALARLKFSN